MVRSLYRLVVKYCFIDLGINQITQVYEKMNEKRYFVIERMPNWKCFQICEQSLAIGVRFIDACFEFKRDAECYYEMVSKAREDSEFQIIKVIVAPLQINTRK